LEREVDMTRARIYKPAKTAMQRALTVLYARAVEEDPKALGMVRAAALSTDKIVKAAGLEALARTLTPEMMNEQDLKQLEDESICLV